MKKLFLLLALALLALTLRFTYTRLMVDQEFGPSSMPAASILSVGTLTLIVSFFLIGGKYQEKVMGFWTVTVASKVTYLAAGLLAGYFLITPLSPGLVPDPILCSIDCLFTIPPRS